MDETQSQALAKAYRRRGTGPGSLRERLSQHTAPALAHCPLSHLLKLTSEFRSPPRKSPDQY